MQNDNAMNTEQRFQRIEHLTAGLAEERRKDREEYKTLWRDTQRQLNEVSTRLVQFSEADSRLIEADARLEARIAQLAEESRAANKNLEARIESLVFRSQLKTRPTG
ncbi:MAG: hypothetical protein ABSB88_14065 [Bryobacteraceae bacterium]|jgi:hypothetical protein